LVRLLCGCSLHAAEGEIISNAVIDCDFSRLRSPAPEYPVNLAILENFYDLTNLSEARNLQRSSLYGSTGLPNFAPLTIPQFSENMTNLLAADTELSYSLSKLTANLQNESVVLRSPMEALIYDYLERQTSSVTRVDWTDWQTWTLTVVVPLCIILVVLNYRFYQRMNNLNNLITAKAALGLLLPHGGAKAQAVGLKPALTQPPAVGTVVTSDADKSVNVLLDMIVNIRHVDIALIVTFTIITFALLWAFIVVLRRALSPHSYVYLEFKNGTQAFFCKVWMFPDASRYYSVAVPAAGLKVALKYFGICGLLSISAKNWFIWHTLSDKRLELPKAIWLGPFAAKRLKKLTSSGEFSVTPIVVHNHEFDFGNSRDTESRPLLRPATGQDDLLFV
jgi:hypothetical protein